MRQYDDHVLYHEVLPHVNLQPFIYCYWQLCTTRPLDHAYTYRVVADGCIDIFFNAANPVENFVMGFCKKYTLFPLDNIFNYVGIRFLPTMFTQLFKIDASTLSDRFEQLNNVLPDVSSFIAQRLQGALLLQDVAPHLDDCFNTTLHKAAFDADVRLYRAIEAIIKAAGVMPITHLDTGVSARQLRRLFDFYVGDTPKVFSQVVRFQNILKAKPSVQSLKQNALFHYESYYDQAHFIKAFKTFYGVTPAKAFGR